MGQPKYCSDAYSNAHHALCCALNGVNDVRIAMKRIDETLQSIRAAVADVSEMWNASNSALHRLPSEVLGQFFYPLQFSERVSASGVSRKWRAAALEEHGLWTELHIHYRHSQHSIVESILARSGSLPLSITWRGPPDPEDDDWSCVVENMARMERLAFYDDLTHVDVLNRPAPLLKEFMGSEGVFSVPSKWGGNGAPQLRALHLGRFTLSAARRLPSVRVVAGWAHTAVDAEDHGSLDYSRLFELFPSLSLLDLRNIWPNSLLPVGHLPSMIRVVSLRSARDDQLLPYGHWLSRWLGYPAEYLELNNPADLGGPLEYFARANRGSFSMSIWTRKEYASIRAQVNGSTAHLKISMKAANLTLPHFFRTAAPYFYALTNLACPAGQILSFAFEVQSLPTLTSLTIAVGSQLDATLLESLHTVSNMAQLYAPQLDTLRFDTGDPDATPRVAVWFAHTMPLTLGSWLLFDRPKLYRAVLRVLKCDAIYEKSFSTKDLNQVAESINIHFRMECDGDLLA